MGTDPNDPASCLLIWLELAGQGGVDVHFPYLANRTYSVESSEDLLNWAATPVEELGFDSGGLAVWSDTTTAAAHRRFYRLVVR